MDLAKLCGYGNVRFILADVCNIDTSNKEIYCADGRPPIRYDIVSVNVGISPDMKQIDPSKIESLSPVKPISTFANRWDNILQRILNDSSRKTKHVVIIGGGAGGTELSFAMNYRIKSELIAKNKDPSTVKVSIVTRGHTILSEHNK